ncbi:glycoprotein [Saesbyeol virus]|uniref:glycoprotein n=1 Tax=Saesbyeol virus TaxID=2320522 RepID=UPI000EB7682D|nr:glycoprotein [Saesbyeol virus]AXY66751.1 glycoprotein [Saesbyeol virus]
MSTMGSLRELSKIALVIVTTVAIILYATGDGEVASTVAFAGYSGVLLLYTISKQEFASEQNKYLYNIMRHSKKVKRTVAGETVANKKIIEEDDETPIFYNESKKISKKSLKNISIGAAASLFFDNIDQASALKICCRPFKLMHFNSIIIDHAKGGMEHILITDDWFTPGPEKQTISINGTKYCEYNMYCMNAAYKFIIDSSWYIGFSMFLMAALKVALYSYKIFKTPTGSVTIEYHQDNCFATENIKNKTKKNNKRPKNDRIYTGSETDSAERGSLIKEPRYQEDLVKITRTTHTYCSGLRVVLVLLYIISFVSILSWGLSLMSTTGVSGFTISKEDTITIDGKKATIEEFIEIMKQEDDGVLVMANKKENIRMKRELTSVIDGIQPMEMNQTSTTEQSLTAGPDNKSPEDIYVNRLTCLYDQETYYLTGKLETHCVVNSSSLGIMMVPSENSLIKRVDSRCKSSLSISLARFGTPVCLKVCTMVDDCEIYYEPNQANKIKIPYSLKDVLKYNMNEMGNSNKIRTDTVEIKISRRAKRSITISKPVSDFGQGVHIVEGWRTQFENENGGVFLAEEGPLDDCMAGIPTNVNKYVRCTPLRRQVISCEPNLWAHYTIGSNMYECKVPTKEEFEKMPAWRKSGTTIPYTVPPNKHSGKIDRFIHKMEIGTESYLKVEMLWGEKYQDSVQQIGGLKYHIYSTVFKVTAHGLDSKTPFPKLWDSMITKANRWVDRKYTGYRMHSLETDLPNGLPEILIKVKHIEEPNTNNMWQDRAYVNFVFKSDIFASDGTKISPSDTDPACIPSDSSKDCVYLVPVYYAIRVYGPLLADIKFFGYVVDTIAFDNNVCTSVNAIRVKGVCYIPDMSTVSTDVVVGGYPWTEWSGIFTSSTKAIFELFSFYQNHPKVGSGQYLSAVSDSANIGHFSVNGKCSDMYYHSGKLMCMGSNVVNIKMVEYTTFHRPLMSPPSCSTYPNNSLVCHFSDPTEVTRCTHDPYLTRKQDNCSTTIIKKMDHTVDEAAGLTVKTPQVVFHLQRGFDGCKGTCFFASIIEVGYRCSWCLAIIVIAAGIGYIALIVHLLVILICFINGYTIGRLLRLLGLRSLFRCPLTTACSICGMYSYSANEAAKHKLFCSSTQCPYCITLDESNNLCILEFPTRANHREHMKLHKMVRINPYLGVIRMKRYRVATFFLVQLALAGLSGVNAQYFPAETGLRSNAVGLNISIPADSVECSDKGCKVIKDYNAHIPLVDGSSIIMRTKVDGKAFAKKITVENPNMDVTCDYLYTSSEVVVGPRRIVYTCSGKTECTEKTEIDLLTKPIANRGATDDFIPIDTENPLKSLYCPKATSCRSPIIDFMWIPAGCFTVNDGTAIGYEYYMPSIKKEMVHVFRCTVRNIKYKICEGALCKKIDGSSSDLEQGVLKFEHISSKLPIQFMVGAMSRQGDDKPSHIFHGVPDLRTDGSNTNFAYRMTMIPQGETCMEGTSYYGGKCDINTDGSSPALNCKSTLPKIDSDTLIKNYESLHEVYHCNFENSMLRWNTKVVPREITVNKKTTKDTQTVSWPSLNLTSINCNFGFTDINLLTFGHTTMEIVRYTGAITKVVCTGSYNRNGMTQLEFNIKEHSGMLELHCPMLFSETCLFDTVKTNKCNITTLLPFNSTCLYNGQSINIDCSKLELSSADPLSGNIVGWTGSQSKDTWISGFKIGLSNWWYITMIAVGTTSILIFMLWLVITIVNNCKTMKLAMTYSKVQEAGFEDTEDVIAGAGVSKMMQGARELKDSKLRRRTMKARNMSSG